MLSASVLIPLYCSFTQTEPENENGSSVYLEEQHHLKNVLTVLILGVCDVILLCSLNL